MVVKAPPTCPGAVLLIAAVMAAALPARRPQRGQRARTPRSARALVGHPGVDMVSFTGGVATGQAVMAAAAATTRPVVLELGGNDPAILAPDVEVDAALADRLVEAAFRRSGQVCMAIKRLYVHRDRWPRRGGAAARRLAREVVGDGLADEVTMGPVHTAAARDRVEAFVAEAEAAGAVVHRPGRLRAEDEGSGGYFVSPALVEAPPARIASIVREEQFAPALPVIPYDDIDDAVAAANDTAVRPVRVGVEQRRRAGLRHRGAPRRGDRLRQRARHRAPWTCTRRWAGGSSRASASSSGPRACRPSPANASRCGARARHGLEVHA